MGDDYQEKLRGPMLSALRNLNLDYESLLIKSSEIICDLLDQLDHSEGQVISERSSAFIEGIRAQKTAQASSGGRKRVEIDARQKDKQFVFQCWRTWQKNPTQYRSKTAFARDMLDKCEFLVSDKVITDWCREWEKMEPSRLSEQSAG